MNFVQEIKMLYLLNHQNVVRVFNYYLYPDKFTGYILMELVKGTEIDQYLNENPENIDRIFLQTIDGFEHLEKNSILHRDIRPQNIMVSNEGVTKIIDFGFGKRVASTNDFGKSISLNWWCEPPAEFRDEIYDYATEVYFVGKLFQKIIIESGIEQFSYKEILARMCAPQPAHRLSSFSKLRQEILLGRISEINFSEANRKIYRLFADQLVSAIAKIDVSTRYFDNPSDVLRKLEDAYHKVMLETHVPKNSPFLSAFLNGPYYFSNSTRVSVSAIRDFISFFRSCSREKQKIVLSNLFSRLDAISRYDDTPTLDDDEIPF